MATVQVWHSDGKTKYLNLYCSYGSGKFTLTGVNGYYDWGKSHNATKDFAHTLNVPGGSGTFWSYAGSGGNGTGAGVNSGSGHDWNIGSGITVNGGGSGYVSVVATGTGQAYCGTYTSKSKIDIGSAITAPWVTSQWAQDITSSSAKLYLEYNSGGGSCWGGFDVSTDGGSTWKYYEGTWGCSLTGLKRYTTYWYRGYIANAAGGMNPSWGSFTTLPEKPTVSDVTVSNITSTSAKLTASVTDNGGKAIEQSAIDVYSNSNCSTWIGGVGSHNGTITGLSRYTTYWTKAWARNIKDNDSYLDWSNNVVSFTTLAETPVLSAITVSNIKYNAATCTFSITDNGGRSIADSNIDVFTEQACTNKVSTISSRSGELGSLSPNTTYYARGNASNGSYRGYTAVKSFTTVKPAAPTISSITTPTIQDKSIKVQLNATAGAGASSLQYRFSKDNGSTYTSWQSANNYTFTGLQDDTSYTFKAQVKDNYGTTSTSGSKSATTTWVDSVKVITSSGVKPARVYVVKTSGVTKVHKRNIKTI